MPVCFSVGDILISPDGMRKICPLFIRIDRKVIQTLNFLVCLPPSPTFPNTH